MDQAGAQIYSLGQHTAFGISYNGKCISALLMSSSCQPMQHSYENEFNIDQGSEAVKSVATLIGISSTSNHTDFQQILTA